MTILVVYNNAFSNKVFTLSVQVRLGMLKVYILYFIAIIY